MEPTYALSAAGLNTTLNEPIDPGVVTTGSVTSDDSEKGPTNETAVTSRSLPPLLK